MDPNEIERFRQLLLKKREDILGASKHNMESAQEFGTDGLADFGDQGSIESNRTVLASLSEAEKKEVVEIDDALFRIKNSTYGKCQNCGEPVGDKRLNVKPEAQYCIKCQNGAEGKR